MQKSLNITTIVTTVFCERKVVMDKLHDRAHNDTATNAQTRLNIQFGKNAHEAYAKNSFALLHEQKKQTHSGNILKVMLLNMYSSLKNLLTHICRRLIDFIYKRHNH